MKFSSLSVRRKALGGYLLLLAGMVFLNYALPFREPLAFGLFFAALSCGLNPFVCAMEYLLASFPALSWLATLSAAVQSAFLLLVYLIYRRLKRIPASERFAYAIVGQLPFVLLFPHDGYALLPIASIWQKAILALLFFLFTVLADGGFYALLKRAFRCRLPSHSLAQICLLWTLTGLGIANACKETALVFLALSGLFSAIILLKNANAIAFSVALSLPLCLSNSSLLPCALFVAYACIALLFLPYGRLAAALSLICAFLVAEYLGGLFALSPLSIALRLLACALPALTLALLPNTLLFRARNTLLFYRAKTLPRVAINRNRRAVGERLYEVSALFREIGQAFSVEREDDSAVALLQERLTGVLCRECNNRTRCTQSGVYEAIQRLIAVGCAKGKVSLVDLPESLSSACRNSTGMLFALNQQLVEYRRYAAEMENARAGRKLLAEQALGVSEILKNLALEQSEEYAFSHEEEALERALAGAGILSSEIFIYGEGSNLTVSMTLADGINGKRLCDVASKALNVPLSLSDKLPLTAERACYILRKKARYDAAFGIAARSKNNAGASGDTHSIVKIDERRFLVALADGMGSGERARETSDNTLNLLESFYKAKMPSAAILSTVNKLLSFSSEETFACLDLASVDLDTGIADVVKIGSPVGFILSQETLRVLEGESLPMGMLETIHPTTLRTELKEDDFLLFMSDGVTSAFGSSTELYSYLSELHPLNPQSLAEEILTHSLHLYDDKAEDDMTVIAVRLTAQA